MSGSDNQTHIARSAPWMPLVFMVFLLLIVGAVVALSFSPVAARLFPASGQPAPAPSGAIDGVPAPDSDITAANVPLPDNDLSEPR
ncbi:MAG: hypothetical protein AAGH64_09130 [Planctomycetota bacterium]